MKIGKAKEPGIAGATPARKKGDPKPPGYVFGKPTSYRPEYCQAIVTYFSNPESWEINEDFKGGKKPIPRAGELARRPRRIRRGIPHRIWSSEVLPDGTLGSRFRYWCRGAHAAN